MPLLNYIEFNTQSKLIQNDIQVTEFELNSQILEKYYYLIPSISFLLILPITIYLLFIYFFRIQYNFLFFYLFLYSLWPSYHYFILSYYITKIKILIESEIYIDFITTILFLDNYIYFYISYLFFYFISSTIPIIIYIINLKYIFYYNYIFIIITILCYLFSHFLFFDFYYYILLILNSLIISNILIFSIIFYNILKKI